jgi:hypothetical protein
MPRLTDEELQQQAVFEREPGGARQEPKACCRTGFSSYKDGEDKR